MSHHIEGRDFDFEVSCDLDLVWRALTTPEGLSSWYVVDAEVDPRPGGRLVADWGVGPAAMGTFAAVAGPNRILLAYGDEEGAGTEEWLLSHEGGITHVRLIHSLPVDDDATWDDTYPGIVRGWSLFMGTLRFVVERVGRLGRSTEVRVGDIAAGAWPRVLSALGLESTPRQGATVDLAGRNAHILVSVDGFSLLVGFGDQASLLIDVEGESLYTVSATYGEESTESTGLLQRIAELADLACTAAGNAEHT